MPGLKDLYKSMVPTNMRTFAESLLGKSDPITENDFSEAELKAMVDLIKGKSASDSKSEKQLRQSVRSKDEYNRFPNMRNGKDVPYESYLAEKEGKISTYDKTRGKTSINYMDYPAESSPDSMGWIDSVKNSYNDPAYGVATTLGQFNAQDTGDSYSVTDNYNWNKSNPATLADMFELFKRPEAVGNALMRLGPQVNRPVNIKLQK